MGLWIGEPVQKKGIWNHNYRGLRSLPVWIRNIFAVSGIEWLDRHRPSFVKLESSLERKRIAFATSSDSPIRFMGMIEAK
jgi:hypothetical protein